MSASNGIAIGVGAKAQASNSVAIGAGAQATQANQIVLGTPKDTVYIPGNLVVGKDVILNNDDANARVKFRSNVWNGSGANGEILEIWRRECNSHNGILVGRGTANYSGNKFIYDTSSDRRLKHVGKEFTAGLDELKKLELFHFTYKKDKENTPHVGVMAQDLQKVFPDAVTKGDDGFLRIRMEDMFYALINSVKQLDAKFDLLAQKQKKIDELESKLDLVVKDNEDLHKELAEIKKLLKKMDK